MPENKPPELSELVSRLILSSILSPLEAMIFEADYENYISSSAELAQNSLIIHADDYLEVISKAEENGFLKSFMHPRFIQNMQADPSYHFTPAKCNNNGSNYPIHTIKPTHDSVIIYASNHIKIKVLKLAHITVSRFNLILDRFVESNIFSYNQRSVDTSKRHLRESMRQVIKRNFTIHKHEYGFTFTPELSNVLAPMFKRTAIKSVGQCHYLLNNPKKAKLLYTCKAYDITAVQDGKRSAYKTDDKFKLEALRLPTYFKRRGILIQDITYPVTIFQLLLEDNIKILTRFVLAKLTRKERIEFNRLTKTADDKEVQIMISNTRTIQTKIDIHRLNVDNQTRQIESSLRQLLNRDSAMTELKEQVNYLLSAVEDIKNNSNINGTLDDKRKRHPLLLVK